MQISQNLRIALANSFDKAICKALVESKNNYRPADVLSIVENLEQVLITQPTQELVRDEQTTFALFTKGITSSVEQRRLTMASTSFVLQLVDVLRYIILWLNDAKGAQFDVKITSRRKGLISELNKILIKAVEQQQSQSSNVPIIRDRFGLRIIITQNDEKTLLQLVKIVINIFTNKCSKEYLEFTKWITDNSTSKFGGELLNANNLLCFLKDYSLRISHIKDYVTNSKASGYQSWQCTLSVDSSSQNLAGFMFEFQARTSAMHLMAEIGPASHDQYKEIREHLVHGIFEFRNDSDGIIFFAGSDFPDLDLDGITVPAQIVSRHVSPHVVKRT